MLPGQDLTANIITELATDILTLDDRLKALDAQIDETFAEHPQAAIIQSMPGLGPFLDASLLVGAVTYALPQRRSPGCCRRTGPRAERLRPANRQPAPPVAL